MPKVLRPLILALILLLCICCGGNGVGNSIAGGDGISGTGDFELSKVQLANESYGSGNYNDFTLNTLAPILLIEFKEDLPEHPEDYFGIRLTDLNLQESIEVTPGAKAFDSLKIIRSSNPKNLYLHITKKPTLESDKFELRPGHQYLYSIFPLQGQFIVEGQKRVEYSGYLRVRNITLTYVGDFDKGDALAKDLDHLSGIDTLEPEFIIHSRYTLNGLDSEQGPLAALNVSLGGLQLLKGQNYSFFDILEYSSTSTHIQLRRAPLNWGQSLNLNISPTNVSLNTENGVRPLSLEDIPNSLIMSIKDL